MKYFNVVGIGLQGHRPRSKSNKIKFKIMKYIVSLLVIVLFFQGLSKREMPMYTLKISPQPPATTLDSLHGNWASVDDSLWQMNITCRTIYELYKVVDLKHAIYRIYFSDTLVKEDDFDKISIDTTNLSGKYLITREINDNTVWCYEINGFYQDGLDFTLSLASTWAGNKVQVFKKNKLSFVNTDWSRNGGMGIAAKPPADAGLSTVSSFLLLPEELILACLASSQLL